MRRELEVKIYKNFQTSEEEDRQYLLSLTPEERLAIAFALRGDPNTHPRLDRTFTITRREQV